ncbi:N-acetylglucosamine-6-phosphate deacetylase, partial [Vibrio cholerae O1 biovar El Tor]|nr:N-acetylglucosamine-6-phosphate deacetylase [Vibrio cholerae O1 biovar El Tor]
PGAIEAIGQFLDAGVIVAFGHSDADAALAQRSVESGATVATHLFNAMASIHHRRPGPVPGLLSDLRVAVELICDGFH